MREFSITAAIATIIMLMGVVFIPICCTPSASAANAVTTGTAATTGTVTTDTVILVDLQRILDVIVPYRRAMAESREDQVTILADELANPAAHHAAQLRLQRSTRKIEALDAALDLIRELAVFEIERDALPAPTLNPLAGD